MRLSTIKPALRAASIISLAAAQTYTCPAQNNTLITDSNNKQYIIGCGSDTLGGSATSTGVNSFNDCFAACDNYSGCTAFTFSGPSGAATGTTGSGNCYLKTSNSEGFTGSSNNNVAGILYGPSYYYIGTPSPNFICPDDDNTVVYDYNQTAWALKCSSDTNSGSTGTAPTAQYSFDDCFVFCERTPGCTAFTYSGQTNGAGTGTCYLQAGTSENFASSDVNHVAAIKLSNFSGTKGTKTLTYQMGGPLITTGIVVTYTAYYTTVVRKRDMSYSTATVGME
ncbi:WSC-domain-containing protein [Teratosphaeria destructans]|uniref:WSC-domain-containing protein n=1 Tax=Teratosphaeria destructans TaxID=418781 RepID=A0A9W7SMV6_9PEZI|nr:WSC-domain-containing protein [Teratosphaeria destructans]